MEVLDESLSEKIRAIKNKLNAHTSECDTKLDKVWRDADISLKHQKLSNDIIDLLHLVCCAGAEGAFKVDRRYYDKDIKILCTDFKTVLLASPGAYGSLRHFLLVHIDEELQLADYVSRQQYKRDIDVLYDLIAVEVPSEWNEDVLNDIKSSSCPISSAEGQWVRYKDALRCLGMLYAPTFELNPYPGVFLHSGSYKVELGVGSGSLLLYDGKKNGAFQPKTVDNVNQTWVKRFEALSEQLKKYFPTIKNDFTYDLDAILSEPGYYPFESFRYSCGAKPENVSYQPDTSDMYYEPSHKTTWEAYAAEVLEPYLKDIFAKVIYKALGYDFTSEEFIKLYGSKNHASLYNEVCYNKNSEVTQAVTNLIQSICTACILTRHEPDTLYKVKIGVFNRVASGKEVVRELFQDTTFTHGNLGIEYEDGIVSSDAKIGLFIVEWTFCEDKETMDKRPLFGYEAAKKFQIQGRAIDFNSMLLGEDKHGKSLFSIPGGSVHIQDTVVHRFNAGSRSGKGVMTMNILASGLGSGALLFYVDRKPDMAAELAYITGGNMFLVNGGDVQSGEDVHQQYLIPGEGYGPQLQRFGLGVSVCEPLKMVFGQDFGTRYEGAFGDFVYWKAMIFALGIIRARIELCKETKDAREAAMVDLFQANMHVMVVLDEITNWHNNMETAYFSNDPYNGGDDSNLMKYVSQNYGGEAVEIPGLANAEAVLADARKTYSEAKAAKDKDDCDKTRAAFSKAVTAVEKAEKKVAELKNEGAISDKPSCLYWGTFYDKYQSIVDGLASINNAGYKNEMSEMNDVFMIGQKISGYPVMKVDGDLLQLQGNGQKLLRSGYGYCKEPGNDGDKVGSFMLGFAETLRHDWFIGRNFKGKNKDTGVSADFGGAKDKDLYDWLHEHGNWAYVAKGGQEDYRTGTPAKDDVVCFKPYLVLNSNAEPESSGGTVYTQELAKAHEGDEYKYVYGVAERVGFDTWEKIRTRLLDETCRPPSYGSLHPGVGLKGLIEEYHKTTQPEWTFKSDCMCGSKVMADAICAYFGYSDYMEYLLDMSPMGIIGADDMLNLIKDKQFRSDKDYQLKKRFPRYFNTGNEGLLNGEAVDTASDLKGVVKKPFTGYVDTSNSDVKAPSEGVSERPTPTPETVEFTTNERFDDKFLRQLAEWIVNRVAGASGVQLSQTVFNQAVAVAASELRGRGY